MPEVTPPPPKFADLVGAVLTAIEFQDANRDPMSGWKEAARVRFTTSDGTRYLMHHWQECCEVVYLEDVCGEVSDLLGSPILLAEETTNDADTDADPYDRGIQQWTFYKLATVKGHVTLRWFGESTGWYSVDVDFDYYP